SGLFSPCLLSDLVAGIFRPIDFAECFLHRLNFDLRALREIRRAVLKNDDEAKREDHKQREPEQLSNQRDHLPECKSAKSRVNGKAITRFRFRNAVRASE